MSNVSNSGPTLGNQLAYELPDDLIREIFHRAFKDENLARINRLQHRVLLSANHPYAKVKDEVFREIKSGLDAPDAPFTQYFPKLVPLLTNQGQRNLLDYPIVDDVTYFSNYQNAVISTLSKMTQIFDSGSVVIAKLEDKLREVQVGGLFTLIVPKNKEDMASGNTSEMLSLAIHGNDYKKNREVTKFIKNSEGWRFDQVWTNSSQTYDPKDVEWHNMAQAFEENCHNEGRRDCLNEGEGFFKMLIEGTHPHVRLATDQERLEFIQANQNNIAEM